MKKPSAKDVSRFDELDRRWRGERIGDKSGLWGDEPEEHRRLASRLARSVVESHASKRPKSIPYVATPDQRAQSEACASFEEMGQLECDVIEWFFVECRGLSQRLERSKKPVGTIVKVGID